MPEIDPERSTPLMPIRQYEARLPVMGALIEVDRFVRAREARALFDVAGRGLTVAVLDTGLRRTHIDVAGRIRVERNFTTDNGDDDNDASDGNGHGTHVAGIIAANGPPLIGHVGIAPESAIAPLKILRNFKGQGDWVDVRDALQWLIDHHEQFAITAINISMQNGENHISDTIPIPNTLFSGEIAAHIRTLRDRNIPTIVSAGNYYHHYNPSTDAIAEQGMGFPAILRDCISVGAVFDSPGGPSDLGEFGTAFTRKPGQITPFSQRLHSAVNPDAATVIFAPGSTILSSGILNDQAESEENGTSMAAPVVTGVILLMQELHLRLTGTLPSVAELELWLTQGSVPIFDGDDENDNVLHTHLTYRRIDAVEALSVLQSYVIETASKSRVAFLPNAIGEFVPVE